MKSTKVAKELFADWEQTNRTCGIITPLEINYQFHLSTYRGDHFFFRSMYNKTISILGFCDIQNNQGLGKGYHPQPSAVFGWLITPTSTLIILDITKTESNNCLLPVLRPSISSLQSATSEGHKCYYKVRWRVMCDRYYKVRQNRLVFKSSLIIIDDNRSRGLKQLSRLISKQETGNNISIRKISVWHLSYLFSFKWWNPFDP